jgi:hypothetical protein
LQRAGPVRAGPALLRAWSLKHTAGAFNTQPLSMRDDCCAITRMITQHAIFHVRYHSCDQHTAGALNTHHTNDSVRSRSGPGRTGPASPANTDHMNDCAVAAGRAGPGRPRRRSAGARRRGAGASELLVPALVRANCIIIQARLGLDRVLSSTVSDTAVDRTRSRAC